MRIEFASAMHQMIWRIGSRGGEVLPLDRARIMGILNVTPDSFSDGGAHANADDAVRAAIRMKEEGACIIDVGGESTRPGALPVDADEQIRRTVPVIEGIRRRIGSDELLVSIDTTRAEVARAALDAGANIINDIAAGRDDEQMLPLAAGRGCGLILMHRRVAPPHDSYSDRYATAPDYGGDVVGSIRRFLCERCDAAVVAGVRRDAIVIDPGLGFGKTVEQNYELIARTPKLLELGYPMLSAASRKSFIGAATGEDDPSKRIFGSVAVSMAHFLAGVRLFRVHDVAAHHQALSAAEQVVRSRAR